MPVKTESVPLRVRINGTITLTEKVEPYTYLRSWNYFCPASKQISNSQYENSSASCWLDIFNPRCVVGLPFRIGKDLRSTRRAESSSDQFSSQGEVSSAHNRSRFGSCDRRIAWSRRRRGHA